MNKKTLRWIIVFIAVCVIYIAFQLVIEMLSKDEKIIKPINSDDASVLEKLEANNKEILERLGKKNVTFMILGTDERASETSRSDIIMLVKYFPAKNQAILISIPRDTRVEIPGIKTDKINHAHAFGGVKLSKSTIEKLFNTTVDYYLKFSFEDFKGFIDDVEGVEVNSKKDYGYNNEVQVAKGNQLLLGEDALFYVRFRYDEEGDFGRIKRQQEVIESLSHSLRKKDQETLIKIINDNYENIETNMNISDMIDYTVFFENKEQVDIQARTLKTSSKIIDKIYYGIYDNSDLEEIKSLLNQ